MDIYDWMTKKTIFCDLQVQTKSKTQRNTILNYQELSGKWEKLLQFAIEEFNIHRSAVPYSDRAASVLITNFDKLKQYVSSWFEDL